MIDTREAAQASTTSGDADDLVHAFHHTHPEIGTCGADLTDVVEVEDCRLDELCVVCMDLIDASPTLCPRCHTPW